MKQSFSTTSDNLQQIVLHNVKTGILFINIPLNGTQLVFTNKLFESL